MKTYTIKEVNRYLRRMETRISKGGDKELINIGKWMVSNAKSLAPYQTGALYRLITSTVSKNSKQVWLKQGNPGNTNPNNNGDPYNYAYEMSIENSWVANHIRSGRADYMKATGKSAKKKFSRDIRGHIKRAISFK